MSETIVLSARFPVSAETLYDAWLDGDEHARMTGAPATASTQVGGAISAWDGYITAENLALERPRRIVQSWRAADFPPNAPPSTLVVRFEADAGGTRITIVHEGLPDAMGDGFTDGWKTYYFTPMRAYFGEAPAPAKRARSGAPPAKTAAPAKRSAAKAPAKKAAAAKPANRAAAAKPNATKRG